MLNHAWSLITTTRRVLVPPDSTGTARLQDSDSSATEVSSVNWSDVGQAESLETATKEAMAAVHHAAVRCHTLKHL